MIYGFLKIITAYMWCYVQFICSLFFLLVNYCLRFKTVSQVSCCSVIGVVATRLRKALLFEENLIPCVDQKGLSLRTSDELISVCWSFPGYRVPEPRQAVRCGQVWLWNRFWQPGLTAALRPGQCCSIHPPFHHSSSQIKHGLMAQR